jgi:TonB family protein
LPVISPEPDSQRSILDESRSDEGYSAVQRIAVTGLLAGLLLHSLAVHAQQNNACAPIPPEQPAKLCWSNDPPLYPPKAKAAGVEGTVVVFAQINKSGRIDLARVVSGPEQLQEAALNAVKRWVYRPYLIDGSPTGFRTVIKVKFKIDKPPAQSSP